MSYEGEGMGWDGGYCVVMCLLLSFTRRWALNNAFHAYTISVHT